jgi:hypothetical protein
MTFTGLLIVSSLAALVGVVEQVWYLVVTFGDLRRSRESAAAVRYYVWSRILSSVTLAVVHLVVVTSTAIVFQTRARNAPVSLVVWELGYGRLAISLLVIMSTTANLFARSWAMRR